ncbi:hypothetical protein M427DRAFT_50506 [Gonapodya prolifera JEL478]|uniref:Uncharacterized protein n=1 Tax=Gonapodya prolifera (strain JEL478) TaxID=1344416 RepID=A0A139AZI7_GONPJ|nr:hypothetical protein M427DRAFT_50506 [Gonapodya prolifera JEL478]|eukprot:KXS22146.1 hypothetical protein M427DRAFT_50506 [Gonapodya prolifera JEL478]
MTEADRVDEAAQMRAGGDGDLKDLSPDLGVSYPFQDADCLDVSKSGQQAANKEDANEDPVKRRVVILQYQRNF